MLKKLTLIAALGVSVSFGALASPITPEQALSRLGTSASPKAAAKGAVAKLVYTQTTESGAPAAYIFNNGEGYMVLSADDLAYPMLGYSDGGSFDAENIAPQMKWWLGEYAREIAAAGQSGSAVKTPASVTPRAAKESIAPLVKTKWDQGAPYNQECPKSMMRNTYTGCVATSMAQVMNYWKYPEIGEGEISYKATKIGRNLSINFGEQKFDWANMLDNYSTTKYTDEQANAVAYLMKACGYSVKMNYGLDASGAYSFDIPYAMKNYFKYDGNAHEELRIYYGPQQWEDMIYEQLATVGPVIYGGQSATDGGHSFVVDGYDGNGYFHVNWGWSGMSDGYFLLSAMDPDSLGAGGGGGGFNYSQHAMFDLQPPTGKPVQEIPQRITQYGSLTGTVSGTSLKFSLKDYEVPTWVNNTAEEMTVILGAIFEPVSGDAALAEGVMYKNTNSGPLTFPAGSGIYQYNPETGYRYTPEVKLAGLKNGTYKVTFATQNQNKTDAPWEPVLTPYGLCNYLYVTKQGLTFTVTDAESAVINIVDVTVDSELYYGCNVKITIKAKNDGNLELQQGYAPVFYNGDTPRFMGESIMLTVGPGETVEKTYTPSLYTLSGAGSITADTKLYLTLIEVESESVLNEEVWKEVTMKANPGAPAFSQKEFSLVDATTGFESVLGQAMTVYTVTDKTAIGVNAKFELTKNYFAYPMYAVIFKEPADKPGNFDEVTRFLTGEIQFLSAGETGDFSTTFDFENASDEVYFLTYYYVYNNYLNQLTNMLPFRVATSGVSEASMDKDGICIVKVPGETTFTVMAGAGVESVEVYDVSGVRQNCSVNMNGNEAAVETSGSGVKIVVAADRNGNSRTFKVVI